ncbi:hypothetical protein BS78_01G200400 [Paspalum vaginatum]|nr:hypothetical protein BS78_01G200400 [Paspalum vaginatum]
MTQRFNDKFPIAKFVVSQMKDREHRLKKDYNAVKTICSKSGFGWDNNRQMATTIDGLWSELPENLRKMRNKPFPYYDDLHGIYNANIFPVVLSLLEKLQRGSTTKFVEEDYGQMSTPSPTIPVTQSFVDLVQGGIDLSAEDGFDFEVNGSQYRELVGKETDGQAHDYSQAQADLSNMQESQKRKLGASDCASTEIPVRQEREKKKSKRNDNAMNELIALRKEELETYKELTEKKLEMKRTQMQQSDPSNDPYSMSKCMDKLRSLCLPQLDYLKAINFLKGDREAREIFMCCHEDSLADAYIKGSISY